ncbi:unnamed protein product [Lepeophtheirus salmonis]|uniref:(salmon louse) hypothetical protein n=1 Tax=Lepeophtheirus salmonis TaxID=72036 RepID=A0A7R8H798_LEPSM|nr:unnamed protein product [Lepeophtheirus salmonis]CAF2919276.1 unnamed protein product [Lepeophtheirus salmonis]
MTYSDIGVNDVSPPRIIHELTSQFVNGCGKDLKEWIRSGEGSLQKNLISFFKTLRQAIMTCGSCDSSFSESYSSCALHSQHADSLLRPITSFDFNPTIQFQSPST